MSLDLCNLDLLICFTNYLDVHDILAFSSCDRRLYLLLGVESIWKRLCRVNFGITYNHPNQLYRILYQNSYQQKYGRLPCQHISNIQIDFNLLLCEFQRLKLDNNNNTIQSNEDNNNDENNFYNFVSCSQCYIRSVENLFLCVHPGCRKIVCDNHSRIHARVHNSNQHGIFFKPNTCELYCHTCVDWLGGFDSDPAEQYKITLLMKEWELKLHDQYPYQLKAKILELRTKRRYERYLRWKDTPQRIINNGYCFISASWMKEWELFIEGRVTYPPTRTLDNDQWRLSDGSLQLSIHFNPFSSNSSDLMIISVQTWDYLIKNYKVKGNQITENDLKSHNMYKQLEYWKSRIK